MTEARITTSRKPAGPSHFFWDFLAISPIRKSRFVKGLSELLLFFDALTRAENRERIWLTAPLKRQMLEALPDATSAGPPAFQTLSLAPGALQCVE